MRDWSRHTVDGIRLPADGEDSLLFKLFKPFLLNLFPKIQLNTPGNWIEHKIILENSSSSSQRKGKTNLPTFISLFLWCQNYNRMLSISFPFSFQSQYHCISISQWCAGISLLGWLGTGDGRIAGDSHSFLFWWQLNNVCDCGKGGGVKDSSCTHTVINSILNIVCVS